MQYPGLTWTQQWLQTIHGLYHLRQLATEQNATVFGAYTQEPRYALAHFASSLVGKGYGQNTVRRRSTGLNKIRNPVRQRFGLATACPGLNQQRPVSSFDCAFLLWIKPL